MKYSEIKPAKPKLAEDASVGSTSAGNVASVVAPFFSEQPPVETKPKKKKKPALIKRI